MRRRDALPRVPLIRKDPIFRGRTEDSANSNRPPAREAPGAGEPNLMI